MRGLDSWADEGMNFTIGLCFCFDQKSSAKCETPLPSAYWDETCMSLLASYILWKQKYFGSFIYIHAGMCMCAFIIELKLVKKKKVPALLIYSIILQNVLISIYEIPTLLKL